MKTAQEIQDGLKNFYGTEQYHRWSPLFRKHVLTDGVKWLCDNASCYWLVDAIASYHAKCMKDPMLQGIQFWTLTVHNPPKEKKGERIMATLICERDTDDVAITQEIPYTDFPLPEIKLYCQPSGDGNMVILLPSEY